MFLESSLTSSPFKREEFVPELATAMLKTTSETKKVWIIMMAIVNFLS